MNDGKLLIVATIILLLEAGTILAGGEERVSSDATTASVAALKANLGDVSGLEIDEVRVTGAGVACINYRVGDSKTRGHAVVRGNEVLKSADNANFEKVWNEHCLGPRGGMTSDE